MPEQMLEQQSNECRIFSNRSRPHIQATVPASFKTVSVMISSRNQWKRGVNDLGDVIISLFRDVVLLASCPNRCLTQGHHHAQFPQFVQMLAKMSQ